MTEFAIAMRDDLLAFYDIVISPTNLLPVVVTVIFCIWSSFKVLDMISNQNDAHNCKQIVIARRRARDEVLHKTITMTTQSAEPLIVDAISLIEDFKNGTRKCSDIMLHHIKRTHAIGNKVLNSVTEELYDEAYETALQLDQSYSSKTTKKNSGLLYGIPISIKDNFYIKGTDSTLGISARCFKPALEDGILIKAIREAGGIPYVKSNIPQLLMKPESDNDIWGVANNPWDVTRTPGGSSGGEAALIASRCSTLGLGNSICMISLYNNYNMCI